MSNSDVVRLKSLSSQHVTFQTTVTNMDRVEIVLSKLNYYCGQKRCKFEISSIFVFTQKSLKSSIGISSWVNAQKRTFHFQQTLFLTVLNYLNSHKDKKPISNCFNLNP